MEIGLLTNREATQLAEMIGFWRPDIAHRLRAGTFSYTNTNLIALQNGAVVGWLEGHHEQPCLWRHLERYADKPDDWRCSYIIHLYTDDRWRGRGIASALLTEFERESMANGNSLIILTPDSSEAGLEERLQVFYSKRGYELAGESAGHYYYLMSKDLIK